MAAMHSTVADFERHPTEKLIKLATTLPDGAPVKAAVLAALAKKQGGGTGIEPE
jgi:hypothetical protein